MADESLLDENVRIPQENVFTRAKVNKVFNNEPTDKGYLAQVYATAAFVFGLASIGSYAVSRNYIEPSHFAPTPSLWWGAVYLFSIANLILRPTTQRWKLGKKYSTPTSLEKWFYVSLFSLCSGILLPSIFGYLSTFPSLGNCLESVGMNINGTIANITLPKVATDIIGTTQNVLFDRRLFSDSLFMTSAILIVYCFCALISNSDIGFLMASVGAMGGCVVGWNTVRELLGVSSLLRFDTYTMQKVLSLFFAHLMGQWYHIQKELREGEDNVLLHSARFIADTCTGYSWRLARNLCITAYNSIQSHNLKKLNPIPGARVDTVEVPAE